MTKMRHRKNFKQITTGFNTEFSLDRLRSLPFDLPIFEARINRVMSFPRFLVL